MEIGNLTNSRAACTHGEQQAPAGRITSAERVRRVLNFEKPDYVPLYDVYWGGFLNAWRRERCLPPRSDVPIDDVVLDDTDMLDYYHIDLFQVAPDEQPWPSRQAVLEQQGGYILERDGWGRLLRRRSTSPYGEPLENRLTTKGQLDTLNFEPACLSARYSGMMASIDKAGRLIHLPYVFIKIGGPFLRSSFLRGEYQWYLDIASDLAFASDLADRVTDFLIDVGVEAIRRSQLGGSSIWIFDDVASNRGLLISPTTYERLFLPRLQRMVAAFKAEGVEHVGFHSDGDIRAIVEGLLDAGITILNPLEPRANMDPVTIRRRYGQRAALVGGLCNSLILPDGSDADVRTHVERVLSVAQEGGLVLGAHSIGPDIAVDRYDSLMKILCEYGRPAPGRS